MTKPIGEKIISVAIDQIQPFPNHPFQVNEDEALERLKESIAENGVLTAVHNAFDPSYVIEAFYNGQTVTSITGYEYSAIDFCRMVEYAAYSVDINIDGAEKIFPKKKEQKDKKLSRAYFFYDEFLVISGVGNVSYVPCSLELSNAKKYRYTRTNRIRKKV